MGSTCPIYSRSSSTSRSSATKKIYGRRTVRSGPCRRGIRATNISQHKAKRQERGKDCLFHLFHSPHLRAALAPERSRAYFQNLPITHSCSPFQIEQPSGKDVPIIRRTCSIRLHQGPLSSRPILRSILSEAHDLSGEKNDLSGKTRRHVTHTLALAGPKRKRDSTTMGKNQKQR